MMASISPVSTAEIDAAQGLDAQVAAAVSPFQVAGFQHRHQASSSIRISPLAFSASEIAARRSTARISPWIISLPGLQRKGAAWAAGPHSA